jgi:membrane-associated phospholipid phosphatase
MVSPDNPVFVAAPRAKRVARRWPFVSGLAVVDLALALDALIVVRDKGLPLTVDTQWNDRVGREPCTRLGFLSLVMTNIGGGVIATFIVPVLIIAALLMLKRRWAAGCYLVATVLTVLTGGIVQLLKHLFGRARQGSLMVNVEFRSFPSGHVANAAAMAVIVIVSILFPGLWIWIAGAVYTSVMMISRTYLGAHWLSDTIGGLLL